MVDVVAARASLERAEADLFAAEAVAYVTGGPELRYAPLDADGARWVAGRDGRVVGWLWPAHPGQALTGWTAAASEDGERVGPYATARAAAASLD